MYEIIRKDWILTFPAGQLEFWQSVMDELGWVQDPFGPKWLIRGGFSADISWLMSITTIQIVTSSKVIDLDFYPCNYRRPQDMKISELKDQKAVVETIKALMTEHGV